MIYFDNSATTLHKPKEVLDAVYYAMEHFGNPSRSFCEASLLATREIYKTREVLAHFIQLTQPLNIAFTASSTESLNLVIQSLITKNDHVITTVLEHNAVLRPLYQTTCELSVIPCDEKGNLLYEAVEKLIKKNTKAIICTHGSNVIGNVVNVEKLYEVCQKHKILLILDISQTLGCIPVKANMADIMCFTGHKGLYGPQGTGGIIVSKDIDFSLVKTGGSGNHTFDRHQNTCMPDIFEVGTLNSHGIYGLKKGIEFIETVSLDAIYKKEMELTYLFYQSIKKMPEITIYGDFDTTIRLPVIALNIGNYNSSEISQILCDRFNIATRGQYHCAPFVHKSFKTEEQGMVRFSFSYFNTKGEILFAIDSIEKIIKEMY